MKYTMGFIMNLVFFGISYMFSWLCTTAPAHSMIEAWLAIVCLATLIFSFIFTVGMLSGAADDRELLRKKGAPIR